MTPLPVAENKTHTFMLYTVLTVFVIKDFLFAFIFSILAWECGWVGVWIGLVSVWSCRKSDL